MPLPDPQGAFVARLRAGFPDWRTGIDYVPDRPSLVVDLVPGAVTRLRRYIDQVRVDISCWGDDATDPRVMAGEVRQYLWTPFLENGQSVFAITAELPNPLVDPTLFETRWIVPVTASISAVSAA